AQNVLTPEARMSAMRIRLIDRMEGIIRESVKPMEHIESIRIMQVDGLAGGGNAGGGHGAGNGDGSLADSVVNSALRFRAQAPLVDQLLREIGVDGGDLGKVARGMLEKGSAAPALTDEKPARGK
ncbi:MAG: flotillin domain-containing protein, partial [Burkholderiales bacterium]